MAKDIKNVIMNGHATLIADTIGAVSLIVILFVGLSLPGTF